MPRRGGRILAGNLGHLTMRPTTGEAKLEELPKMSDTEVDGRNRRYRRFLEF